MHLEYAVTYQDFLVSMKAYRQRAQAAAWVYYLDLWIVPAIGFCTVLVFLRVYFQHDDSWISALKGPALVAIVAVLAVPWAYHLRMKRAYKQRTVLSKDGAVALDCDEQSIKFIVDDKAELSYSWEAFTDYSNERGVITLFVKKAIFHTIPRGMIDSDAWTEFERLVKTHVRKH